MGCKSCGSGGSPNGCGNNGNCGTGGCNRMNTHDWISSLSIHDPSEFSFVEVSFKNGASKSFFHRDHQKDAITGDMVVVTTGSGYDVGHISLSGELVRRQMKKKDVKTSAVKGKIIRIANDRDIDKMHEARSLEQNALVKSRVIARTLGLDMKIGDVEYQADLKKATIYYTAEGRVDFRQLVREYAKEFKVKIEMRQIGARQESGRIGGIGSCGRELCCSTWLSDFKTVTTSAARYQNIAINQTKLSGQCGRLKCCLNYELDTYMDALKKFPKKADNLFTKKGKAVLVKTDIFKGLLFYTHIDEKFRGPIVALDIDRVKEIQEMNANKNYPEDLVDLNALIQEEVEKEMDFADVTGQIELPNKKRRKNRGRNRNRKKPTNQKNKKNHKNQKSDKNDKKVEGKSNQTKRKPKTSAKVKGKQGGNSNTSESKNKQSENPNQQKKKPNSSRRNYRKNKKNSSNNNNQQKDKK